MLGSRVQLGVTRAPTATPIPNDETNTTVHSEQERRSHGTTRHDPGHSTMMVSTPLQQ
jgi:hypothetical protein